MPLQKLTLRPGLNREGTNFSNEGGWYDGDKIRFRSGQVEKIGGWAQLSPTQFLGIARSLWTWIDQNGLSNYLSLGTNLKYYIYYGGTYYDITPIVQTDSLTSAVNTAFSTLNGAITATATSLTLTSGTSFPAAGIIQIGTEQIVYTSKATNVLSGLTRGYNGTTAASHINGSNVGCSTVTITDGAYNPNVTDFIIISGGSAVGGITLSGEYQVYSAPSSTTYTINASTFSTSVDTGGGTISVQYEYPSGRDIETVGTGWGAGPWSRGTWGSSYVTGITLQLRLWTQDNYGADLVLAPRGGSIFYWLSINGTSTRAVYLSSLASSSTVPGTSYTYQQFVPTKTNQAITSSIQQFIIAMGSNSYDPTNPSTSFNPMLVRWSDQANPYQWVPQVTNQSGEFTLTNGSYIMCGQATRQENLIWTDSCLYSMQYVGYPYVWSFQVLMDNISIISPNSIVTVNNVTYWMGHDKFYMYTGVVQTLPCSLRQYIFDDINRDQSFQVFAGANESYNEVWWFYCSQSSTIVDKYVIYNYLDKVWSYGNMSRSAWLQYGIQPYPVAADYNSRLLYHEIGTDDVSTATPQPITAYVQSSDFGIEAGDHVGFVWRVLPDINFNGSTINNPSVTMTLYSKVNSGTYPVQGDVDTVTSGQNYTISPEYTIQTFDGQVYTRVRGRQMSFKVQSKDLGVAWQLGIPRLDIKPAGRR